MKKVLLVLSMVLLMPNAAQAADPAADASASKWSRWFKNLRRPTRNDYLKARQYVRSQWGCITGSVQCSARKKYALRTLAGAVTAAAAAGIGYGARAYLSSQTGAPAPQVRIRRRRRAMITDTSNTTDEDTTTTTITTAVVDGYDVDRDEAYEEVMKAGKAREITPVQNGVQLSLYLIDYDSANIKAREIIDEGDKGLNEAILAGVNKAMNDLIDQFLEAQRAADRDYGKSTFHDKKADFMATEYRNALNTYDTYKAFAQQAARKLEAGGGPPLPAPLVGDVDEAAFEEAGAADLPPPPSVAGSDSDDDDDILIGG